MVSVCLPSDALLQHLPSYWGFSYLRHGVSLQGCSSKAQLLLFTLDEGYLLTAAVPDLQRGIAPLGPPVPAQYGYESWTIKKAECQRIDAFELWCWRRLLRVLWTARRSNQSIIKEIRTGCSLEGLMLKLKLLHFGYLMRRADSFEKTLMLGKIGGRRRRG